MDSELEEKDNIFLIKELINDEILKYQAEKLKNEGKQKK